MEMFTQRLQAQGAALGVLARRQQVLSANIANADTPGFQARDIDFAAALAQANAAQGPVTTVATSARHLRVSSSRALRADSIAPRSAFSCSV